MNLLLRIPVFILAATLCACSGGTSFSANEPLTLDGEYSVSFELNDESASGSECQSRDGEFEVSGSVLSGIIDREFPMTGTVNADETVTGVISFASGEKLMDYNGSFFIAGFTGTWIDITGCSGFWNSTNVAI